MAKPAFRLDSIELKLAGNAGMVEILRGVSGEIVAGETIGIVGPSGSGKSSLLMLMAGLERATGGRIEALGNDLGEMNEDRLAQFRSRNMGIVFQSFHLIPTMTALENVAIPLELAGAERAFGRAESALQQVGIAHRAGHYPAQLSGGEQQRVALARSSVGEPAILLADEPTGNLDGKTGETIVSLLFDLHASRNTTLVLVTHDEALASRCNRVWRMRDGRIESDSAAVGAGERVSA